MTPQRGSAMTPEQWQRLKALFEEAISRPSAQHPEYIARLRSEDPALADHLNSLIRGHQQPTSPIDQPLFQLDTSAARRPSFAPGDLVVNRFQIVRMLGMGGMGEVYEAHDLELGVEMGRIALKTIRPEIASSPTILARFKQEVTLARRVSGHHVCRIHEFFVTEALADGKPLAFLTMQFLEGVTLTARLREGTPLTWPEACDIAIQLCAGLSAIHEAGIIHRDLKSRNIMLVPSPTGVHVVVMDFGLATDALPGAGPRESGITLPGAVLGTPEYMAPEQFEGKPLSPATDIYALGIVFYELATGIHPFTAPTPIAAAMRRAKRPPPVSSIRKDVPRRWDQVIETCLAYDPAERFQNAFAVANALQGRSSSGLRLPRWAFITAALLLVAVLVAAYFATRQRAYRPSSPEAEVWYDKGTASLREGSYLAATGQLSRALEFDPNFVLAHARLADAWAELDFTGKAQQEMLRASIEPGSLPRIDREYVEAVRNTLILNFPRAVELYGHILDELPQDQKAYGLIDLGRAYEKAGKTDDAIRAFNSARFQKPENAAPYVRLGILDTRLKRTKEAESNFERARSIFASDHNTNGLAEIDYQLGYAANTQMDLKKARASLQASYDNSRDNVQLETRALTGLSTTAYLSGNTDESKQFARQAIELAQSNHLEYWSIDALNRLGSAYFAANDLAAAESNFTQAQKLAQASQRPRLEAFANVMLASIRDLQGKPEQAIPLAQAALDFYKPRGFFTEADGALTLLNRAMVDRGDFTDALQSGRQLLENAKHSANPPSIALAEETLGNDLFSLQQYPEARDHFQAALAIARRLHSPIDDLLMESGEVLWRLGRYDEAAQILGQVRSGAAARPDDAIELNRINAHMRLSQLRFADVVRLSERANLAGIPPSHRDSFAELLAFRGRALAALGKYPAAEQACREALAEAEQSGRKNDIAEASLALAFVYVAGPHPELAKSLADTARATFNVAGRLESEWLTVLCLARYYSRVNMPAPAGVEARDTARKALDILSELQHTWSTADRDSYSARPDIHSYRSELETLAAH